VPWQRTSKYAGLFAVLPATFTVNEAEKVFNNTRTAVYNLLVRLEKRGLIKRIKQGVYKKIVASDCV
jgi:predicted transcriptional regulator of viral defense system